ncbi:rRNA maturation RNase YbeY [[Mycoplasma] cavipharyngis]|uniref:rRNA maturation RNase YbeY n=1 Tax=[Mycoplasma] cavipharyngis TaxID=92757 RepID=UPI003704462A
MRFKIFNKNQYFITDKMMSNFEIITNEISKILKIKEDFYFEVNFVSKYMIQEINKKYLNKDKVTDVLSFSYLNLEFNQNLLGEIFICYDKCVAQSKAYGTTLNREISFMFLHGFLHLLGYDHITEEDRKKMFSFQDLILDKIYE